MANQITDNRTILFQGNSTGADNGGSWTTLSSTSPTLDTDVKIEGTGSIAEQITNSARQLLWDNGSTMDLSNRHIYMWVNCGIVGLLATKASGGFTIRLTGPSAADFVEWYVGGSDSWPLATAGGWVQFVVDTASTPSNTGGTPPALTAIQGVGISAVTNGTMTKVADNTWVDTCWTLADGNSGIIVEGRNGGITPWTFADILTQLGTSSGAIKAGNAGEFVLNTPLQIGINDTTIHEFDDTNALVLWDNQEFVAADLYKISALGNSGGTTNVTLGIKSGTGGTATGAQGATIQAAAAGVRWAMDFNDTNLDSVGLYGCNFIHGGTFDLDSSVVDLVNTLFLDCDKANVAGASIVKASVVDANTADGTAFMVTDDFDQIINCSFEFSDGHAIELTAATPTGQNNVGNQFSGYTNTVNSTDAAILNSGTGSLTISSSGGSNLQTNSYRNTGGGSVTIQNNISVTLTGLKDNTEVAVYNNATGALIAQAEPATSGTTNNRTFTFSAPAATVVYITVLNLNWTLPPNNRISNFTVPSSDTSIPITQVTDRNYTNP